MAEHIRLIRVSGRIYRHYSTRHQPLPTSLVESTSEDQTTTASSSSAAAAAVMVGGQVAQSIPAAYTRTMQFERPLGFIDRDLERRIEGELGVRLQWDKHDRTQIEVTSPSVEHLESRMDRLRRMLNLSRRYTHFIGIPLNNPAVVERLNNVVVPTLTSILSEAPEARFHESLFMPSHRFHVTLCMLRLHDDEQLQLAKHILNDKIAPLMTQLFRDSETRSLRMHSLSSFQKNALQKARVVYFDAEEGPARVTVHQLVNQLRQELYVADMITKKELDESWAMHSTILNVKYRKDDAGSKLAIDSNTTSSSSTQTQGGHRKRHHRHGRHGRGGFNDHFDASAIFAQYPVGQRCDLLYDVPIELKTLEISALKVDHDTGYYFREHSINFPCEM